MTTISSNYEYWYRTRPSAPVPVRYWLIVWLIDGHTGTNCNLGFSCCILFARTRYRTWRGGTRRTMPPPAHAGQRSDPGGCSRPCSRSLTSIRQGSTVVPSSNLAHNFTKKMVLQILSWAKLWQWVEDRILSEQGCGLGWSDFYFFDRTEDGT